MRCLCSGPTVAQRAHLWKPRQRHVILQIHACSSRLNACFDALCYEYLTVNKDRNSGQSPRSALELSSVPRVRSLSVSLLQPPPILSLHCHTRARWDIHGRVHLSADQASCARIPACCLRCATSRRNRAVYHGPSIDSCFPTHSHPVADHCSCSTAYSYTGLPRFPLILLVCYQVPEWVPRSFVFGLVSLA